MVASVADDGVAPAVAEASTKLLTSPEVDELECGETYFAPWRPKTASYGLTRRQKKHRNTQKRY